EPHVKIVDHDVVLDAKQFGLSGDIIVTAPVVQRPATLAAASVTHEAIKPRKDVEAAAAKFVDMLFTHGRIEAPVARRAKVRGMAASPGNGRAARGPKQVSGLKTHKLVKTKDGHKLERLRFLCGCSRAW